MFKFYMSYLCAVVSGSVLFIKEVIKYTTMETIIHHLSLSVEKFMLFTDDQEKPPIPYHPDPHSPPDGDIKYLWL